ncbi:cocaine esterase-like [Cylas formicarius]|uniref:cocaine esterase-like n=1 Tax=Cylas formicarius TaxID=197179 RepID=UPI0029584E43|nr:cocaine esterase-like [Cylas formicarius]
MLRTTFLLATTILSLTGADPIIGITTGQLRGREIQTENISLYAFEGVPFASPPVGSLRFQAPVPAEPWEGIRDATKSGKCCISVNYNPSIENEDCLFVNIYTPSRNITDPLPVMVNFYGGGFETGCATYDEFGSGPLVNEDVIVVTFNYRLGIYGFLSTGDDVILGNAGLKDQVFALKWVQQNIAYFGGDPGKVTIFGQSAGGISIGVHLMNKKSQGLYRAAICESGCSLIGLYQTDPKFNAYAAAKLLNIFITDQNTTEDIKNFLQSQPVETLSGLLNIGKVLIGVVLEAESDDAYVTQLNFPLLESGDFNQVPLMLGNVNAEFLASGCILTLAIAALYDLSVTNLIPPSLEALSGTDLTEVGNIIKEAYVGKSGSFVANISQALELTSDNFVRPTIKQAELQSNFSPVYLYEFSFVGTPSEGRDIIPGGGRVAHSDELAYIFDNAAVPLKTYDDYLTRQRIVRLWSNFAKTMNPTPDVTDPLLNVTWPQVTPTNIQCLDIGATLEAKLNRKAGQLAMWNEVFYTYGTRPFKGF